MSLVRVLGIGSPSGDDQLGWIVVEKLQQLTAFKTYPGHALAFKCCDRPGVRLLEEMRGSRCVFLVDAIKTGHATGTIHHFQDKEIEALSSTVSTHQIGLAEALKLGNALKLLPEKIIFYGIEVSNTQSTESFSSSLMPAIKKLVPQLKKEILHWLKDPSLRSG